jgi:hypothetical protein
MCDIPAVKERAHVYMFSAIYHFTSAGKGIYELVIIHILLIFRKSS